MSHTLRLDYPPSANRLWRQVRGRMIQSPEAKAWKERVGWIARAEGLRLLEAGVAVEVLLHPRLTKSGRASKTRIDLDNAIKATLDGLQGIAYQDDKQITRIVAEVGEPVQDGGLTVIVERA